MLKAGSSLRLAVVSFLAATIYIPGLFSAPSMPRWWVIALGVPLIGDIDTGRLSPVIANLGLLGLSWAAILTALNPDLYGGVLHLIELAILFGVVMVAAQVDEIDTALTWFAAGVGISALIAVPQYFEWWSPVPQGNAPAGLFYSSEVLAELSAPVLVWLLLSRKWALAVVLAIPLVLGHSRVGIAALAVGLVWGSPLHRWAKVGLLGLIVAVGGAALFWIGEGKAVSAFSRFILWGTAILSMDTPWGHALGWWQAAHPFPYEQFVHSDVLQAMVELGFGALAFLGIAAVILFRSIGPQGGAFAAVCVECMVSFPLHTPAAGFLAAVLTGWLGRSGAFVREPRLSCRADPSSYFRWASPFGAGLVKRW